MAGATASNPVTLITDRSALISGLFLPAGGYWSVAGLGCGTGFFIKRGTNNDGIHSGVPNAAVPSDPGPPATARGMNVSPSNFMLNCPEGYTGDISRVAVTNCTFKSLTLMRLYTFPI
jgi:hypothetical protein